MIVYATLQNNLYTIIKSFFSTSSVIWQNQNSPRPAKPYISLFLSGIQRVGEDSISSSDSTGKIRMIGNREFTLKVNCFGDGSIGILSNMVDAFTRNTVLQMIRTYDLVYIDSDPVEDMAELVDSRYEPRAVVDLHFRIASLDIDTVSFINEVSMVETIRNENSHTISIAPVTITVTL